LAWKPPCGDCVDGDGWGTLDRELVMSKDPVAFMSYVRADDAHEDSRLTQFRERLASGLTPAFFKRLACREELSRETAMRLSGFTMVARASSRTTIFERTSAAPGIWLQTASPM
jgi:hypothetical protein